MNHSILMLFLLLFSANLPAQTRYDLLLRGGHVIDPKNNINGVMDVAIASGKIARVAPAIPPAEARQVVDVRGLYVSPGLIDIHVHVYADASSKGARALSIYPDGFTFRSGVTTAVDAGTSGWRTFPDFKAGIIDHSKTRILALLNIVGWGMGGGRVEQSTEDMDPEAAAKMAKQYPGVIVGFKAAHYAGKDWADVDRCVAAGKLAELPAMIDFGISRPGRTYQELVLDHLRPGDIHTHMYGGTRPILDDDYRLLPFLKEARRRGVKFDMGHGGNSFWWNQAAPAIREGWVPDTISTDIHVQSMNAGMKDMITTMSKILSLGVPLFDVIKMSTLNPATQMKHPELGCLSPGAGADVAVLRLEKGRFGYLDVHNARFMGAQKLVCELTLRDGKVVWDLNGLAGEDWEKYYANPEHSKPPSHPPRAGASPASR